MNKYIYPVVYIILHNMGQWKIKMKYNKMREIYTTYKNNLQVDSCL